MGHHSYLVAGDCQFLYTRGHYNEELAALFTETDRKLIVADGSDVTPGDEWEESGGTLGYYTNANALRQRLNVQGFTSRRALADLTEGIAHWRKAYNSPSRLQERQARGVLVRPPREPTELLTAIGEAIRPHRPKKSFATFQEYFLYEDALTEIVTDIEELRWFVEERSLIRLIIDQAEQLSIPVDHCGEPQVARSH
jgi:HEPN/Toprim N-terminal domain 1